MNSKIALSQTEQLLIGGISVLIIYVLYNAFKNRNDFLTFWSPMTFLGFICAYYCVIGPLFYLRNGITYFKLVEHRGFFENAWIASLVMLFCIVIGYSITSKPFKIRMKVFSDIGKLKRTILTTYVLVIIVFIIYTGGAFFQYLNPLAENIEELGYTGDLKNYFILVINVLIPLVGFCTILWMRDKLSFGLLVILFLIPTFIYMSFGFRYRLVILFVTVAASYYLSVRKKPSLIAVFVALTLGVGVMGFIGMTRNYFSGLSLERASKSGPAEFLESGFQEAVIFMTSGMIISRIPSPRYDFIYLDPIIEAISIPIPRKIWADKPSGDHIQYVYEVYNPGNSGVSKGSAWLVFGEFYLMYGWPSIVVCSLFLGWLLKRLFLWMKNNIHNPYVIVIYSTALGSLYFVISRGYFPQHVMLFFFTVFPGYLLSRNSK